MTPVDNAGQPCPGPNATINLLALRHNLRVVRKHSADAKIMAVIKADAYGHGMLSVVNALHDVDMLAVARLSEGKALRQAGVRQRILVLEGFFEQQEIASAIKHQLEITIHQSYQVEMLENSRALTGSLKFWLKLDTGMHRLGLDTDEAAACYRRLLQLDCCNEPPSLMTHFANADDMNKTGTLAQIAAFDEFATNYDAELSLANSAGILAWPDSRRHWVRPGIMLYGASPMLGMDAADHQLKPVMTFSSQLLAVKYLQQGDCVGYGSDWCCPEAMPVGVVAVGYGDGYPRHAKSGTPILVNGQRTKIVGRVSMDMVTVDLRGVKASVGDPVILWGEGLPVEEIARAAGTISYELFCGVTSRVEFRYVNEA